MAATMTPPQEILLEQIRQHLQTLDNRYDFARRLANENHWPLSFAYEVVLEYAKFLCVAKEVDHPVVPPAYIDKAWHLHLLHTDAYWSDLCPNILQKPLHHEPALRAKTDALRLEDSAKQTLNSYRRLFGELPPLWLALPTNNVCPSYEKYGFVFMGLSFGCAIAALCLFFGQNIIAGVFGVVALITSFACLVKAQGNAEFVRPRSAPFLHQSLDRTKAVCSGNAGDATSSGGYSCGGGGH